MREVKIQVSGTYRRLSLTLREAIISRHRTLVTHLVRRTEVSMQVVKERTVTAILVGTWTNQR